MCIFITVVTVLIAITYLIWVNMERMGEMKNACRLLVGKPEGKRTLGKPRRG
jgi:hypothetical protein